MISKFAKAQKGWIAKLILTLTALSFMSLFGITGYLSSASNNRTVIKVDNFEISQAEFSYAFQKELNAAKNIMDIDLNDEANDELRSALMNALTQRMVREAILDRTAQKYHVSFRPELISRVIANEPAFQDISGNFNPDLFRRILSESNISEQEYTNSVRRGLAEQILVGWPVKNIRVPNTLLDAELKVDNKRRTFKYVIIRPEDMKVDRKITEDEIEQYYEDFAPSFTAPETRDLSVLYLSVEDILKNMNISEEEIKAYYDEHIDDYEQKEKRNVLQMMFENQDTANEAYEKLQKGSDFYDIAETLANQTKEETDLGSVSEDELVFEIAEDVFALSKDGYTKPIKIGDVWQIMKVTDIKAPTKTDYAVAAKEIKSELLNEGAYDEIYDVLNKIEDELGAGKTLEEIAPSFGASILTVKALSDDGTAQNTPEKLTNLIKSSDFIDAAFSYEIGETSSTIETDDGLVVLRVENITESHLKDIKEVKSEIKDLWTESEKTAIMQEIITNIMNDLQSGDDLSKSARRYNLPVYKSQPITRNETFADLDYATIRELFIEDLHTPYQATSGENHIIAVAEQNFENSAPLSDNEKKLAQIKIQQTLENDLRKAMLDSYAKNYNIKIKYELMGIEN